ncbi:MAG: hypothetical protein MUO72_04410 [Bacteroidales bacterium]|nr:hypothetical protein [Bacteroidales bacterium]
MKNNDIIMNPNELVQFLKKPPHDFTRDDIVRFIEAKGITMLNFRYVAEDGKLKSLNFVPFSKGHFESILTAGERVDGSSLFSFMESGSGMHIHRLIACWHGEKYLKRTGFSHQM